GKQGEDLSQVDRQFDQAAARISAVHFLHPIVVGFARENGLIPPMPTLSRREEGSFSPSGIQAFQDSLNEDLSHTSLDGPDLTDRFLQDLKRASEFHLGDKAEPFPPIDAPDERAQRIRDFFGQDHVGMRAVTHVTNQNLGNTLRKYILPNTPHGPFQASVGGDLANPANNTPPRFTISPTKDGGYRVAFREWVQAGG